LPVADVIGVEICGSLKNVLAIAAGIVEGLELGPNAMAALVSQGCAEIRWLATKMGGKTATISGLSGQLQAASVRFQKSQWPAQHLLCDCWFEWRSSGCFMRQAAIRLLLQPAIDRHSCFCCMFELTLDCRGHKSCRLVVFAVPFCVFLHVGLLLSSAHAGLGDIMLTCYGSLSRNRTVGVRLGRGEKLSDILASSSQVAEGVATAGVQCVAACAAGSKELQDGFTGGRAELLCTLCQSRVFFAALRQCSIVVVLYCHCPSHPLFDIL
jgi:hypothetical protein